MNDFLSDQEKDLLKSFYKNETMREAVKKVILFGLYNNGVLKPGDKSDALRNAAFNLVSNRGENTNEQIGADLRAMWEGVNALENAYDLIASFIPEPTPANPTVNRAR